MIWHTVKLLRGNKRYYTDSHCLDSKILCNELLVKSLPTKLPRVTVYLDAYMKKDLETLAKLDKRSVSNLLYTWVVDNIESAKREGK